MKATNGLPNSVRVPHDPEDPSLVTRGSGRWGCDPLPGLPGKAVFMVPMVDMGYGRHFHMASAAVLFVMN